MLIASAVFAIRSIGRITTKFSRRFTDTNNRTTKATNGITKSLRMCSARTAEADIGTDTTCGADTRPRHALPPDDPPGFPPEAVLCAVKSDHRSRRSCGRVVAFQACCLVDQRTRELQHRTSRSIPNQRYLLFFRMGAKLVDDIGFPVRRAVLRVGRVQRRL